MIPVDGAGRNRHAVNTLFFTGNKTEQEGTREKENSLEFFILPYCLHRNNEFLNLSIAPWELQPSYY